MAVHEVIRPLERDVAESFGFQCPDDGDTDGQRQAGKKAGSLLETPAEREGETAAGDRGPAPPATAAPCRLPLGRQHHAVDVPSLRAAGELARRRFDLVDDLDRDGRDRRAGRSRCGEFGKKPPDRLGIEEVRCFEQPVAAALDPFQCQPGRFGLLQHLRNAGTRQAHLGGKILAGMEGAVGKFPQQCESKRSKH